MGRPNLEVLELGNADLPGDLPLPDLRVPFGVGFALGLGIGLMISGVYL